MSTSQEILDQRRNDVNERIASGIQSVTVDGTTVSSFSPRQQLEALAEEERREQSRSGRSPFRLTPIHSKGI